MASQIPVIFRRNRFKIGFPIFLFGVLLIVAVYFSSFKSMGIVGFIFLMIFLVRGILMMKMPYLSLSDHRLTVYRGFFLQPRTFHLNTIDQVYSLKPEAYIELLSEGPFPERKIKIDLRPLERKDRIRFIFLLESQINRKKILEHSMEKEGVWTQ